MRNLLQTTARLQFHLVRNDERIVRAFKKIDKVLYEKEMRKAGKMPEEEEVEPVMTGDTSATEDLAEVDETAAEGDTTATDTSATDDMAATDTSAADTAAKKSDEEMQKEYFEKHPFTTLFATFFSANEKARLQQVNYEIEQFPEGRYMFRINADQIDKFNEILARPEIQPLIPAEYTIALSAKPDRNLAQEQNC